MSGSDSEMQDAEPVYEAEDDWTRLPGDGYWNRTQRNSIAHLSGSRLGEWLGINPRDKHGYFPRCGVSAVARQEMSMRWNASRALAIGPSSKSPTQSTGEPFACKWGRMNESKAIKAYIALTGYTLVEKDSYFMEYDAQRHIGAAPDAVIKDHDGRTGLLEVKCPLSLHQEPLQNAEAPTKWLLQLWCELLVYPEAEFVDLVLWSDGSLWVWRMIRDDIAFHEPYERVTKKRLACGSIECKTVLSEPATLEGVLLHDMEKFGKVPYPALIEGCSPDEMSHIRHEFAAVGRHCVHKLKFNGSNIRFVPMVDILEELPTNPWKYTVVDRIANPLTVSPKPLDYMQLSRWLNVHWCSIADKSLCYVFKSATQSGGTHVIMAEDGEKNASVPARGAIESQYWLLKFPDGTPLTTELIMW